MRPLTSNFTPVARRGDRRPTRLLAGALAVALAAALPATAAGPADPAALVDPMIGTLGSGFVFPGPAAPYGMVQLSPDTDGYFAYTGYQWGDAFIRGFSHVHVQSMGVPEGGNIPFMPTAGPVVSTDVDRYKSPYSHALEHAEAGSYRVKLLTYGIDAELTAGLRVGMHRYTFPPGLQRNVLIDVGRQVPGGDDTPPFRIPGTNLASVRKLDARTVAGTANVDLAADDGYPVHFAARFSQEFSSFGVWEHRGDPVRNGVSSIEGDGAGAVVSFGPSGPRIVLAKVGISFTSQANALANLEDELPGKDFDFDGLRARTRAAWRDALRSIEVSGGTLADRRSFATALYHAQHHPNVFNDADGSYLGHDGVVHRIGDPGDPMPAGTTYYANFSLWDTYRGEMQLLALIAPDRMRDMMRSWRAIIYQGRRIPRWSLMNTHADFMNGEPALQSFADAYCRGLVPDDAIDDLYAEARYRALVERRDPSYLTHGFVPYDVNGPGDVGSGASSTLEHALGDLALALVADGRGEAADRDVLLAQAANWRNVFDPETRFVRPRAADGSWLTPYHPELPDGFREGTGWQYTWLVPHDVRGLFDAMGAAPRNGDAFVRSRLDQFFLTPLAVAAPHLVAELQQKLTLYGIAYYGNQYAPSNEHDLQAPYLYDWTSEPWKTQALARAYQTLFRATPDGLPGNDDLGSMSAWFVWSALGFYPVVAGAPVYMIGSPLFEHASIRLPGGGRFTVDAPGASLAAKYVQGATLNGHPLTKTWFSHDAFGPAGTLRFGMGVVPNRSWGAGPGAKPPSLSDGDLAAFACTPA